MLKLLNKLYFFILLLTLFSVNIFAIVEGTYPDSTNLKKYSVFGSVVTTGNTMMATTPPGNVNDILLSESSGDLKNMPFDAEIVSAHIFWSGSLGPSLFVPDDNITLLTKDNDIHNIQADSCKVVTNMEGFYYCSADITTTIVNQNIVNYNGRYTVSNLKGDVGDCETNPYICQAKYAAWSMVVVYKSKSAKVKREILLYDSFLHLDEREDSIGITHFDITNLTVNSPARGEFTYFGLEGDRFLGVPPQDAPENQYPCDTCYDFISLNNVKLYDDLNPPNNIWNSSIATAVDIDTFKIGNQGLNILRSGTNKTIHVKLGSGDGIIPNEHPEAGGGESVFLGYVLLALDTISPNFRTTNTNLIVDRTVASQGDELTYILTVTNDGSKIAHNVIVSNLIPPETTYVDNSTYIDGVLASNDIATPMGLNIGTIDFRGTNNKKIITFRVKIKSTAIDGTYVYNKAKIISDETINDPSLTNQVKTLINAPVLQTPILTVRDENGGSYLPGEWVEYSVKILNNSNNPISNLVYENTLGLDFTQIMLSSIPFNASDNSNLANKKISISSIQVPARSAIFIKYRAKIKTIQEYIDSGTPEDQINNKSISNQGELSISTRPELILTDNDNGGNEHDPTVFTIKKEVNANFSDSTMTVENTNGSSEFHPGDRVKYTIKVKNSATATVNAINVLNDIDENYFEEITVNNGFYDGDKLTWLIASLAPSAETTLIFTAKIKKPQANGLVIQNQASIFVAGRSDLTDDPTTTILDDPTKFTITASSSNFIFSTKEVIDENGGTYFQQGDYVTYVIKIKNTGEAVGGNLTVEDSINSNLVDIEVFNNGVYNNNKITWNYINTPELVNVSGEVTLKFRAKIKSTVANGTVISNQAFISSTDSPRTYLTDDPTTSSVSDSTNFTVNSAAELTESYKTYEDLNGGDIEPGDEIKYTIQLRNTGNLEVTNISVIDNVDTNNLENIIVEDNGIYSNGNINWAGITSLAPHTNLELHFTAKIKENTTHNTKISNQAIIMSTEIPFAFTDDPNTAEKDDATSFLVMAIPDLSFTKTVVNTNGTTEFKIGDRVKYTINIVNNSSSETGNITITDLIPRDLENVTLSSGGILNGNQAYFYLQPITSPIALTIEGDIKASGEICNQASLEDVNFNYTINSDDPNTLSENDSTCFNVIQVIKVENFKKTFTDINGGNIEPNDIIEYELSFDNNSDVSLNNLVITDNIDTNLTDINLIDGGYFNGNIITFNSLNTPKLANIAPNTSVIIKFRAKIKTPLANNTVISNQAELNIEDINLVSDNPNTPIENDATEFNIVSSPKIKFTKVVKNVNNSTEYKPNDNVMYTITALNTGTEIANNILIKDILSNDLTNLSASQGSFNNNEFTLNLPQLNVNQPITITINAKIKDSVSNNTVISNQASLDSDNTNQILSDDSDTPIANDQTKFTVTRETLPTNLKAYKTSDKKIYFNNDIVTYTIELKNEGQTTVNNIILTDELNSNLEFISATNNAVFTNGVIKWDYNTSPDLLSIMPNNSVNITIKAKVKNTVSDSTIIENQASFTFNNEPEIHLTDDPSTPQFDTTKITVASYDVSDSTKEVFDSNNDGAFVPNEELTYKITIKNSSSITTIRDINVVDYFPFSKLDLLDTTGLIINETSKTITFTPENFPELLELAPNTSVELILRAKIKDLATNGTTISNQAFISFNGENQNIPTDDPKTTDIDDATNFKLSAKADLSDFTKTVASDNGYFPNEEIRYTIKVKNKGTAKAKNLIITDSIDDNLEIIDAQEGEITANKILFHYNNIDTLKELKSNEEVSFVIKAKIKDGVNNNKIISNQAILNSESIPNSELSDDPTTTQENDATIFKVINSSKLYAEKIAIDLNAGKIEIGDIIRYQIKVYNKGYKTSFDTKLYDEIPSYTQYIENSTKLNDETVADNNGVAPFIDGMDLGDIDIYDNTDNTVKIITFEVKILDTAPDGAKIENQASIENADGEKAVTDDPNTSQENDATVIYLDDSSSIFNKFDKTAILEDTNNNGKADIGELIKYQIELDIKDLPETITIEDAIPQNTNYVFGSLQVNRIHQTDEQDTDMAYFENNKAYFKIYPFEDTNTKASLSFKVEIKEGNKVVNQAKTFFDNKTYLSDDPNTPIKNDATITYIGDTQEANLSIKKEVKDINGGITLANDELEYKITVQNTGNKEAENSEIIDDLPESLEYISNSEELSDVSAHYIYNPNIGNGQIKIYGLNIDKAGKFIVKFRVKIKDTVQKADKITNIATLNNEKQSSASVVIGASAGTASIYGDLSYFNENNEKIALKNYKIEITEIKKAENLKVYTTTTDEDGLFRIDNIKPAEYLLKYYNSNGTFFGEKKLNYLSSENDNKLNLVFIPTGFIYNSKTKSKIDNARIYLYNKTANDNIIHSNCFDLDLVTLPTNQQGQLLESNGLYKFTVKDTNYDKLGICVMGYPKYTFPSSLKKPSFGEVENENGHISNNKYYLEFTPTDNLDILNNNNIALDPIENSIKITKSVDQKTSTANSIITYRIKAQNKSSYSFEGTNGVFIYDLLPKNFKLINKSYKAIITSLDGSQKVIKDIAINLSSQNLTFGPIDFKEGDEIEISYRVAIGSNVKLGKYKNIAYVLDSNLEKLSFEASAVIQIKYDFDFDMGAVIGKVYCDDNKNSYQDIGEIGLKNVDIYNDEGFVSKTDEYGRYHFTVLKPGAHLIKLDKNTLLSGIKPIEEKRTIRITKGLLSKVNFPVDCKEVNKDKKFLAINKKKAKLSPIKDLITLRGNLNKRIFLGNKEITVKNYILKQNKKLVTEDEENTYFIKDLNDKVLVNYYIYKFDKELFSNKTKLTDLYRFIQQRGKLKIKLPANQYLVFAEIVKNNKIYRTAPIISMSQRIPNEKGEGLISFKKLKFEFNPQLFINGRLINSSKSGNLFHVFHKDNLKNASILYKAPNGISVNELMALAVSSSKSVASRNHVSIDGIGASVIENTEVGASASSASAVSAGNSVSSGASNRVSVGDNSNSISDSSGYLDKFLSKKDKNDIKTQYDSFGEDRITKEFASQIKKEQYIKNFYGLRLALPVEGAIIHSDSINIHGFQPENYEITINNNKVIANADGYFDLELKLSNKTKQIIVKVKDNKGRKGKLTRNIKVADLNYFLMAFADGTIGYDKALLDDTNYKYLPDSKVFVQGKAVLYFKGGVKGKTLQKYVGKFFKELKATAHIDTSKMEDYEEFYTNLINPERFYPVYGDKSKETQDIKSRGKVYVKIDADKSSILWGNFNTIIHNSDLVEYDKTLYGFVFDFNKKIGDLKNRATVFYSGDKLTSRILYNEFQGTGGSLYYLQSTFIKEGTQRVKVIVRDRDTGIELYKKILTLNEDYTINYATGTILLKEPLPSFVNSNYLTSGKLEANSLQGNPVYLAISYQADTNFNINSNSTVGFSAKEEYKNVYITGHAIKENRSVASNNSDYSLAGMGIGYKFGKDSYVFTEFAHSSNYDNFSFVSDDGGITFKPIGEEYANVSGNAYSFKAQLSFKDFKLNNKMLNSIVTVFNYQKMDRYFYKVGNRVGNDQGGNKISLISKMDIDKNKKINLKYIGVISNYDLSATATNKLNKHQVTLSYSQQINSKISFAIEHQAGYISQNREEDIELNVSPFNDSFSTNITSLLYRHHVLKDLTISLQQDIIEQYDKRLTAFTIGDRFTTGLGAEYQLTNDIALTALETLKFSGDNSTTAGVKYKINETSSLYLNQKWIKEDKGLSNTLLGAETSLGDGGKLYGEYQLNQEINNSQNSQNRALVGIGKTYKINDKLSIQGGLEHTYYKTATTETKNRSAISLGLQFQLPKEFIFYTKHEIRYDKFDETKLHYTTTNGAEYNLGSDLTLVSKVNFYITENIDANLTEAKMSEISLGFAFRPISYDFFNLLGKYSLISQLRPLSLNDNSIYQESAHVISLAGIYETPFKLELTEKTVLKYGLASENNTSDNLVMTLLWINRLAYHMIEKFDIALEYRLRKMLNFDTNQGFLVEGAYKIKKYFYLGIGYNFTSFTDDIFYMDNDDGGGFFVRISGSF